MSHYLNKEGGGGGGGGGGGAVTNFVLLGYQSVRLILGRYELD